MKESQPIKEMVKTPTLMLMHHLRKIAETKSEALPKPDGK